jgi:hypothetical protein
MRTIANVRPWWRAGVLAVVGGSVLLCACSGSPVSPTAPDVRAADVASGEGVTASALAGPGWCPRCFTEIDPIHVRPTMPVTITASVTNPEGGPAEGTMHASVDLIAADGQRLLVSESDHAIPAPGETVPVSLRFAVPASAAGDYRVELVLTTDSGVRGSLGTTDTWVLDQVLTVLAR